MMLEEDVVVAGRQNGKKDDHSKADQAHLPPSHLSVVIAVSQGQTEQVQTCQG